MFWSVASANKDHHPFPSDEFSAKLVLLNIHSEVAVRRPLASLGAQGSVWCVAVGSTA